MRGVARELQARSLVSGKTLFKREQSAAGVNFEPKGLLLSPVLERVGFDPVKAWMYDP